MNPNLETLCGWAVASSAVLGVMVYVLVLKFVRRFVFCDTHSSQSESGNNEKTEWPIMRVMLHMQNIIVIAVMYACLLGGIHVSLKVLIPVFLILPLIMLFLVLAEMIWKTHSYKRDTMTPNVPN